MRTPQEIWTYTLAELQQQIPKVTFDTWVKNTRAISHKDGYFIISAPDAFTKDWLENRLLTTIQRILGGIVGYQVHLVVTGGDTDVTTLTPSPAYALDIEEEESDLETDYVAIKFYEFDPMKRGFLRMPKYCEWFWQPYLGPVAYATYRFLRSLDKQDEGWGSWHFVSIDEIAATVADGNRQAITGVQRKKNGRKYWQPGAFDRMSQAAIARVEMLGAKRNVSYKVSCLNSLPLLTPAQVETLPEILQIKHAQFLKESSIEYEEWKQLELPTLIQG